MEPATGSVEEIIKEILKRQNLEFSEANHNGEKIDFSQSQILWVTQQWYGMGKWIGRLIQRAYELDRENDNKEDS